MKYNFPSLVSCAAFLAVAAPLMAADNVASEDKQPQLIKLLQSQAPPPQKALACKELAIYGNCDAVPALAPLLADPALASWARIALEAIPDAVADEALRAAMGKLEGRLLIGTINSIGYRRDAKAVDGLIEKLKDSDADVASAAAAALGRIGGDQAVQALVQALASAPDKVRGEVAEGCVLCAEALLNADKSAEAAKLYDTVRAANVPKNKQLEAIRGAILARHSEGIPLLIEQLTSDDKALFDIGLRTARELPGTDVTAMLAKQLDQSKPDRQSLLAMALADRTDAAVAPIMIKLAQNSAPATRIVALGALEQSGDAAAIPVLLTAAAEDNAEIAKTAKAALTRLPGKDVDADLSARLPQASGKSRQVLIDLAAQRRIETALPAIVTSVADADAGVRNAAVQAIGALGNEKQAPDLVKLLEKSSSSTDRADVEKALVALSAHAGTACVPHLMPLARNPDSGLRVVALHALAGVGGTEALATVKAAVNDQDESVQDEAVRTLSTWPNNWPEDVGIAEPLLALAKSGKKTSHQVLGMRGYLQFIQGDAKMQDSEKVTKIGELLPLINRPEEKRLAISVIGAIPAVGALDMLVTLTSDEAVANDACGAIVALAGKKVAGASKEQLRNALQTALDKSTQDNTKQRARRALSRLN
jgi:HEAT repeat protein